MHTVFIHRRYIYQHSDLSLCIEGLIRLQEYLSHLKSQCRWCLWFQFLRFVCLGMFKDSTMVNHHFSLPSRKLCFTFCRHLRSKSKFSCRLIRRLLRKYWARWTSPLAPLPFLVGGDDFPGGGMEGCTEGWLMVNFETATNFGLDVYNWGYQWFVGGWHIYFVCVFFVGAHLKAGGKYMMGLTTCHQFFCLFFFARNSGKPIVIIYCQCQKNKKIRAQILFLPRPSPLLITKDAVASMKAGSVIVDLVPQSLSQTFFWVTWNPPTPRWCRFAYFFFQGHKWMQELYSTV